MPTPITSKTEMYRRLNAGLLGHTLGSVEAVADAEKWTAKGGSWAVRSKVSNKDTAFGLTAEQAMARVRQMPAGTWNLSPMLSDPHRVCYGHLTDGPGGWSLHYSDELKACKLMPSVDGCEQKWRHGLDARMYLRGIMDDIGWQTLLALLDAYPDHCVEFTVMADSAHAYGPSNTIYWEVRTLTGEYERDTWAS